MAHLFAMCAAGESHHPAANVQFFCSRVAEQPVMALATFRFYEELNDFLARNRRKREFDYDCAQGATVKNAIEAVGVPHTEVELIIANGNSVDFSYKVRDGDRIAVYPMFEAVDIRPLLRVRRQPLRRLRFIADAHLGGLARMLRMLGFDTLYSNAFHDDEIRRLSVRDARVVLTRDRELLKCADITHGCFVHALRPMDQWKEVVIRLQLERDARPFTLCMHCNTALQTIDKASVIDMLPENVAKYYQRFATCPGCKRIYWEGTHWKRMQGWLAELLPERFSGA
jgi:uncharacterized protein with PIN domain/putative ubiquitin-RnfH superfamily antitoxin RatB of RatAB toxin-antitoxin module